MATNADRAALERRLAEQVEEWRVDCPCLTTRQPYKCGACVSVWFAEQDDPMQDKAHCNEHSAECGECEGSGYLPGVAEADGTVRRIALQDLLVYADNISDDRLLEFWHQLWNVKFSHPDALLESAMAALAEALEARHGD